MPQSSSDGKAAALVAEGDARFDDGDFVGALERARAALQLAPNLVAAVSLQAAAHDALDEVDSAGAAHEAVLRLAPRSTNAIADVAEFYLRRGTREGNVRWLDRARELAEQGARLASTEPDVAVEFILIASDALLELGGTEPALARIEEALRTVPDDTRLEVERGALLFESCRFREAKQLLESVLRRDAANPSAHHTLGLIAERAGDARDASERFRRARHEAPDDFPIPVHLSAKEFDRAIENALEELPSQIREYLSNVAITVEDVPADDDLFSADPPLSPSVLGMFRGSPIGEKASMDPWSHFPSSIVLYQRNLERFAGSREDLVEQIRVTLQHEVGHFLGLDEEQLRELGLD